MRPNYDDGLRFAYADPPYIGQARRHYGDHPDYAGEVDHAELVAWLERDFDGWALSASMKSLPTIMKLCPDDVLTLAWVKPSAPPMGNHRAYTWEPVIMRPIRHPRHLTKTHLICPQPGYSFREKPAGWVMGQKPDGFAHWVFDCAGLGPDDTFVDLFPGSGAIARAWERWKATAVEQLDLADAATLPPLRPQADRIARTLWEAS